MNLMPQKIKNIKNPNIVSAYLKDGDKKSIIVEADLGTHNKRKAYMEILAELPKIEEMVERKFDTNVDHFDIRMS